LLRRFLATPVIIAVLLYSADGFGRLFDDGDAVVQVVGEANINWTALAVRSVGRGASDRNVVNIAVKRLGAERAAKIDAMRSIMEAIKTIRVDADQAVKDYMATSEYVSTRLNGVVRGAKIIEKKRLPGGGVEVVAEVSMGGAFMEALLPQTGGMTVSAVGEEEYTGLVIDASGLGLTPAVSPKIVDEEGWEIYGSSYVSRMSAIERGIVGYRRDIRAATEDDRVAGNPLIIQGLRSSGEAGTDVVVSRAAAKKI